jgi:hypothetical protein
MGESEDPLTKALIAEPWLVEATFHEQATADKLKVLVRKPVSFSGGGDTWMRDIGWTYRTRRGAEAAADRIRRRGHVQAEVRELT